MAPGREGLIASQGGLGTLWRSGLGTLGLETAEGRCAAGSSLGEHLIPAWQGVRGDGEGVPCQCEPKPEASEAALRPAPEHHRVAVLIHRARQASAFEERSVDEVRDAAGRGARHEPPEMHVGLPDVRGRPGLEGRCEVESDHPYKADAKT